MTKQSASAIRNHAAGQRNLRRKCTCGRIIAGNAAWWSHTHFPDGTDREGHGFDARV